MKNTVRTQNCKRKFFLKEKGSTVKLREVVRLDELPWCILFHHGIRFQMVLANGQSKEVLPCCQKKKKKEVLPGLSPLHITQASWSR